VVVVGAGIAGLTAAAVLAHEGVRVTLCERTEAVGGKLRVQRAGSLTLDAGPTVFTLRPWFEALFRRLGESLDAHLALVPQHTLARHAWADGAQLDLTTDLAETADAIARFAGPDEGRRYLHFCDRAGRTFGALESTYMRAPRPMPWSLPWRAGWRGLPGLLGIAPFARLMDALQREFEHPRLQQLFGRYATYCGSSPWAAPATLMLVAHAERSGVWCVREGMHRIAAALARVALARGAQVRCLAPVERILVERGRAAGVVLESGEHLPADAVVFNGDAAALAQGLLGAAARAAVPAQDPRRRSLSALTWTGCAQVSGFDLAHHSVFFSDDYAGEFADIFGAARLPRTPTVYVCAQDRLGRPHPRPTAERLFWLVNAPASADGRGLTEEEIQACENRTLAHLRRCGLVLRWDRTTVQRTTPADFHARYPGTGGALYGQATHGWRASFQRPGSASRIPGLLLAGGSVHPGPGLPMAATSGWLAAEALLRGRRSPISISRWPTAATPGGTSMR
jgi:1-hydroxycarotenoid 3,4-desaturase